MVLEIFKVNSDFSTKFLRYISINIERTYLVLSITGDHTGQLKNVLRRYVQCITYYYDKNNEILLLKENRKGK